MTFFPSEDFFYRVGRGFVSGSAGVVIRGPASHPYSHSPREERPKDSCCSLRAQHLCGVGNLGQPLSASRVVCRLTSDRDRSQGI